MGQTDRNNVTRIVITEPKQFVVIVKFFSGEIVEVGDSRLDVG